jgi:hydroxymethylbilane synthase
VWQAEWVRNRLAERYPGLAIDVVTIKTTGDKNLDSPLVKIGDKGLFTRDIEALLLSGEIDLAVHSLKDLPTALPEGLAIGAVSRREDVRDVFLPHPRERARGIAGLPMGSTVATGSLRRKCQLLAVRPDLAIVDIRGNLHTRLRKLEESTWAGMILARAGVMRLGWEEKIGETIATSVMLPAVGQGALAVEIRADDASALETVRGIHDAETFAAVSAERALLHRLEGGCQIPVGAFATVHPENGGELTISLEAMVGSLDGSMVVRGSCSGPVADAERIGKELAEHLLHDGADAILRAIRSGIADAHEPLP